MKSPCQTPDEQLLWNRIRRAAQDTVTAVASVIPARFNGERHPHAQPDGPYWDQAITMADVLITQQRRQGFEHLAEIYPEEH